MRQERITNRELSSKLNYTLAQIKTWGVLTCGRDPQADQGSGIARSYDLDSAFKIYLCGSLINEIGAGLKQTANFLNFLWPHLEKFKLLPHFYKEPGFRSFDVELLIFFKPELHCQIRRPIETVVEGGTPSKMSVKYLNEWIPESYNPMGLYHQHDKGAIWIDFTKYFNLFLSLFT